MVSLWVQGFVAGAVCFAACQALVMLATICFLERLDRKLDEQGTD